MTSLKEMAYIYQNEQQQKLSQENQWSNSRAQLYNLDIIFDELYTELSVSTFSEHFRQIDTLGYTSEYLCTFIQLTASSELIAMFSGSNSEVRSEFVFTFFLSHIHKTQQPAPWTFQIKCIILFDRLIQQFLFCKEISQFSLLLFGCSSGETFLGLRTQKLTFSYWQLVSYEAQIIERKEHMLSFKRSQRKQYLKRLTFSQLLQQLQTLEKLFHACFQVTKQLRGRDRQTFKEQLYSVDLVQYLALILAHKLVAYYACTLQCFQESTTSLMNQQETVLKKLEAYCVKFQINSFQLVRFLKIFKNAKGFNDFNFEQFNPFQLADLPQMIRFFLKQSQEQKSPMHQRLAYCGTPSLKVEVREYNEVNVKQRPLNPRIRCPSQHKQNNSAFIQWTTHFSDSFPQKQMMTLDLIMDIRKEEAKSLEINEVTYDLSHQGEVYFDQFQSFADLNGSTDRSSESSKDTPIVYKPHQTSIMEPIFDNIYSQLPNKWNEL